MLRSIIRSTYVLEVCLMGRPVVGMQTAEYFVPGTYYYMNTRNTYEYEADTFRHVFTRIIRVAAVCTR